MSLYIDTYTANGSYNYRDCLCARITVFKQAEKKFFKGFRHVEIGSGDVKINASSLDKLNGGEIRNSHLWNMGRCWDLEWVRERSMAVIQTILEKEFYESEDNKAICIDCDPSLENALNI